MDIYEQMERFDRLIEYVQNELPVFAEQVAATDLIALVTNRVIQRGENFRGETFSPYSVRPIAAFKLWGKSRTSKAEEKVRTLARAKASITYKSFREINNLETDKKNFEFSGEMFRKFGIVKVSNGGGAFLIVIGGTTTAAQDKIDENSAQEGVSIIEASEKEEQIVQAAVLGWLERNAKRILDA